MDRASVKSSNLISQAYDAAKRQLEVEFKSGGVYLVHEVPQSVYDAFMASDSKGGYFHRVLKQYRVTRVDSGQPVTS